MPTRGLYRIALFAERHYRSIFIGAGILAVTSLLLASRVSFDPDVLNLLPEDDPVVRTFRQTLAEFGGLDLLLVVVRVPEGEVIAPYQELVERFGRSLEELPEFEYVEYRIGEPTDLLRSFFPRAFFFADPEDRRAIVERLSDEGIRRRVPELRRQLTTPQALARKQLMVLDPLGLADIFLHRLGSRHGALGIDWTSGYYLSKDRRLLLLLAKPVGAAQELEFCRHLVAVVEDVAAQVEAEWPEIAGPGAPPPPEIGLGGGYLTAFDDASLIRRDLIVNAVSSMGVVLLLFLFAFRRLGLLLYAFLPLTCGLVLTFGVAGAMVGELSSATSGITALLVGLGIDFVIVSYGRYVEERQGGADGSAALRKMSGSCGRAVVVGGITSAATFYAFGITKFTGLRQMGILTATGILLCMVSVLLLLPAMLAWSDARHRRRESQPTLFVHGFGAARLVRFCVAWPRATLALGAVLTVAAGLAIPRLHFEGAIENMRPKGNRGIAVQREVAQHFGTNFKYMMLVVSGDDETAVLDLASRATEGAAALVDEGILNRVDSISALIPPPQRQREVLEWLTAGRSAALDPERIRQSFDAALAAEGLRPEPFADGVDLLTQALEASRMITVEDVKSIDGTSRLIERYLRQSGERWRSVVYLYPPPQVWKRQAPPKAQALAEELGEDAVLTGVNVVSRSLRRQVWIDAWSAGILGALAVAFLLWLDYRNLGDTLLSLFPLIIGIVWMLGVMVALGIDINFMNIFVTTMIIGIGVDYGVHMLHRHRELGGTGLEALVAGLSETGRAIAMAAVTTSVGFGSLVLSHYPGLRSIGYLAILGAVSTSLVAVTVLPAYLVLRYRRRTKT
ncbi:MAG: MMPL family transporter [bacterium]|nr:MMPL family transporter [bacterium]